MVHCVIQSIMQSGGRHKYKIRRSHTAIPYKVSSELECSTDH